MKKKLTYLFTFILTVCLLCAAGVMTVFAAGETDDGLDDNIPALTINSLAYMGDWGSHTLTAYVTTDITMTDWSDSIFNGFVDYKNAQGEVQSGKRHTTSGNMLFFDFKMSNPNQKPSLGDTITVKKGFTITGTAQTEGGPTSRQLKEDVTFECTKSDDEGVTWTIIKEAVELALGDMVNRAGSLNELQIPINDGAQKIIGGWVGEDLATGQSGIITHDRHHSFVSSEEHVKLLYMGETYTIHRFVVYNGWNPAVLWLTFERGRCESAAQADTVALSELGKGAIVSFAPEFVITDGAGGPFTVGENGLNYYYDGAVWSKVTITDSADDITVANADAFISDFRVGNMEKADITFAAGKAAVLTEARSADESVATVNMKGEITAVGTGTATVTFKFGELEKTVSVTVKDALQPDKMQVTVKNSAYADTNGELIAYVGEEPDKAKLIEILEAKLGYENGKFDAPFTITENMISFDGYDNSVAGKSSIKIVNGSVTGTLAVNVYKISSFTGPTAANVSFWGNLPHLNLTSLTTDNDYVNVQIEGNVLTELGVAEYISMKSAEKNGGTEYALRGVNYLYQSQVALGFTNKDSSNMVIGDVLTVKKGFRIYKHDDGGAYIATFELDADVKYVWNGERWAAFAAEAEEISLKSTEVTLAVGSSYTVPYTVLPAGSFIKANISSSDSSAVQVNDDGTLSVLKATEEDSPVTVTIMLGSDETTAKTLTVTAVVAEVVGFEAYAAREINIAQGADFSFEYYYGNDTVAKNIQAVAVFDNGSKGVPFDLTAQNAVVKDFNNEKAGLQTVTLTVTHEQKTFDMTVTVNVRSVAELVSNFVGDDIFSVGANTLYIGFGQSVVNEVNVPASITADELSKYIKFIRGDEEIEVSAVVNGIYVVVEPKFPGNWDAADKKYKEGDQIVLGVGMPFIRWTGDSQNYNMIGAGEYIVAGKIAYPAVYVNSGNKMWSTYIDYVDFTVSSETIELGFGRLGDVGATMVPAYATIGEFTIESSDSGIVSVNANGLIRGEKIGTATLTVTLNHERLQPISKTVTVNVVDVKSGIKFNKSTVYVPTGTVTLTGQTLADLGIKGTYVWASGKVEGEVDFTKVRIQGYSANANGKQEITVRITDNGLSVTGKITVIIGEEPEEGCGCGSEINSAGGIVSALAVSAVLAAAGLAVLIKRRSSAK